MGSVRIYLSVDLEHDEDLVARFVDEASGRRCGYRVCARTEPGAPSLAENARVRRRIADADEVVVICGEHTDASSRVSEELRIAQEEEKPYFLLWGRRNVMCTRPANARPGDGMYSWTHEILRSQIAVTLRNARPLEIPERLKRARSV